MTQTNDAEANDAEEIRQLRAALRKTQRELAELSLDNERLAKELRRAQRTVDGAWEQIAVMRHSSSWRMTAPVRMAKARLRRALR